VASFEAENRGHAAEYSNLGGICGVQAISISTLTVAKNWQIPASIGYF
jgi:hypothetical protein